MSWGNVQDRKIVVMSVLLAISVSGCAMRPEKIHTGYVPSAFYNSLTCAEIEEEAVAVALGLQKFTKKRRRESDYFVGVDTRAGLTLSQLKGEKQAIERVSFVKGCGISFDE